VAAALRGLGISHGQQQSQIIVLLAPHQDGTKQVGDVVTPPGVWTTSGAFPYRVSEQDLPRQYAWLNQHN